MSSESVLVAPPVSAAVPVRSAWSVMCSVVFALFLRELKTRAGGRWLGAIWAVGEPFANAALMLLVYGVLKAHHVAGVDPMMFLVTGLLPFQLFKSLALRLMESIDANQGLFAYRQVQPIDAVLSRVGVETTVSVALMTLTVAVLGWAGHSILPAAPLELLGWSVLLVALGSALGLLFAAATGGIYEPFRALVRLLFFPLYLASGAMFPISAMPAGLRDWLLLNPVLHVLEGLRSAFFGDVYREVPGAGPAVPLVWLLAASVLAISLYRARRDQLQTV